MHLAVRADGGPSIGFGHVVRTAALAKTVLEDGGEVTYLTKTSSSVESVGPPKGGIFELPEETDLKAARTWIEASDPDVVLIDSYDADLDYQSAIRTVANESAVVLDDTRFAVSADYLVNGNVYAPDLEYEWRGTKPTWCLGTEYLLVRETIRCVAVDPQPFDPHAQRAVVTMGGSDIKDTTPEVCGAFDRTDLEIDVIVGPGFENHERIRRAVRETDARFQLHEDPENFPELIAQADFAVSAAGSTTYELLAVGTPTIAIPQADNQRPIAEALSEREAVDYLPAERLDTLESRIEAMSSDPERRRRLRENGRALVDCRGPDRVYRTLRNASL